MNKINKNLIIGLIAALVLAVAGFLMWEKSGVNPQVEPIVVEEQENGETVEDSQNQQPIDEDYGREIESIEDLIDTTEETDPLPKIDTTGWKTYRNEEMGFEVKIPDNWIEKESLNGIDSNSVGFGAKNKNDYSLGEGLYFPSIIMISKHKRNFSQGHTLRELVILRKKRSDNFNVHKMDISDTPAILSGFKPNCNYSAEIYKDENIINISFSACYDGYTKEYKTYLGMLQTFKFID